ncbi:MAG: rod shape-determining protein MreD [Anaerolineae bacterium]|nr:rod shape-determining protein MreD [Anaerolineae bacterium]
MNFYIGIPILLSAAVIQSVWLENVHILGGRPDLVLLLVVTWTIIRGIDDGVIWGFIGGLCCDLLSGGPFGLWTTTLTTISFFTGQPWVYALGPTLIRLALMSAVGTLLAHGTILGLMAVMGYSVSVGNAYQTVAGPAALLNFLLSPFAFQFLVWFHKRAETREGKII